MQTRSKLQISVHRAPLLLLSQLSHPLKRHDARGLDGHVVQVLDHGLVIGLLVKDEISSFLVGDKVAHALKRFQFYSCN
jgi:hypothetical protein